MKNKLEGVTRFTLILLLIGGIFLYQGVGDSIIGLKGAKDFEDVLNGEVRAGDHVKGNVIFLLDSFAIEQTWSESKTGSSTPKKTSAGYYMLPSGEGYIVLRVNAKSISIAQQLIDETYEYLAGGQEPDTELFIDAAVSVMEPELAEMFEESMLEIGYTAQELEAMGEPLIVEPRSFASVWALTAAGAVMFAIGVLLLVKGLRKPKASAQAPDDVVA